MINLLNSIVHVKKQTESDRPTVICNLFTNPRAVLFNRSFQGWASEAWWLVIEDNFEDVWNHLVQQRDYPTTCIPISFRRDLFAVSVFAVDKESKKFFNWVAFRALVGLERPGARAFVAVLQLSCWKRKKAVFSVESRWWRSNSHVGTATKRRLFVPHFSPMFESCGIIANVSLEWRRKPTN